MREHHGFQTAAIENNPSHTRDPRLTPIGVREKPIREHDNVCRLIGEISEHARQRATGS